MSSAADLGAASHGCQPSGLRTMLSITGSMSRGLLIDVCTILEHRTGCCCFSVDNGVVVGKRKGRGAVAVRGCGCTCRLSIETTDCQYRSKEYPITKLNSIPEWRSFQVV